MPIDAGRRNDLFSFRGRLRQEDLLQRFEQLTQLIGDCVFETDSFGCFSWISDKALAVFGRPPVLMRGQQLTALGRFTDDGLDTIIPDWREVNRNLIFRLDGFRGEPDRILEMNVLPVFDPIDGQFTGNRGTARDITEEWESRRDRYLREDIDHTLSKLRAYRGDEQLWLKALGDTLSDLRRIMNADRVCIEEIFGGLVPLPRQCNGLIVSAGANIDRHVNHLPLQREMLMPWTKAFQRNQGISCSEAESEPEIAAMLRSRFTTHMLVLPLFADGKWWGLLVLEKDRPGEKWRDKEQQLLQSCCDRFGSHFSQYRSERARQMLEDRYRDTVRTTGDFIVSWQYESGHISDINTGHTSPEAASPEDFTGIVRLFGPALSTRLKNQLGEFGHGKLSVSREEGAFGQLPGLGPWQITSRLMDGGLVVSAITAADPGNTASPSGVGMNLLTDPLTGLGNRHRFFDRLQDSCARPWTGSKKPETVLVYLSIRQFGLLTARHGEKGMRDILRQTADWIACQSANRAQCGYLGDGRFAIFDRDTDGEGLFVDRLAEIITDIRNGYRVQVDNIPVSISLGVAICCALFPGQSADSLADTARVMADRMAAGSAAAGDDSNLPGITCNDGRYEQRLYECITRRETLTQQLHQGQVALQWQPVRALKSKGCDLVNAVLASDRLDMDGSHVSDEVARVPDLDTVLDAWNILDADWPRRDLALTCRLDRKQLQQADLPALLDRLLTEKGIAKEKLLLEIAKQDLDPDEGRELVRVLAASGYRIIIENFGLRDDNLSMLTEWPIAGIKIDIRNWINRAATPERGKAGLEAIIGYCNNIGLLTIAKTVDNRDLALIAADAGFALAQGWFYASPMAGKQCVEWLEEDYLSRKSNNDGNKNGPTIQLVTS